MSSRYSISIGREPETQVHLTARLKDSYGNDLNVEGNYYGNERSVLEEQIRSDANRVRMQRGLNAVEVDIVERVVKNPAYGS